jgi:VanZ family protein
MKNIIKSWLPVILWAAIIFFFSSNPDPYRYLPAAWRSAVPLPSISTSSAAELLGQLMHFVEYTVLAFLLARALHHTLPTSQKINLLTIFFTMIFALSDEIHQFFVPGRALQVIDLIIDFLGILFGVYLYTRLKIEPQRHEGTKKRTRRILS